MDSTIVLSLQLDFPTIAIAMLVSFLTLSSSNGSYDLYEECSHLVPCGNISEIRYPFWTVGDSWPRRPEHCGHPGFQLHCPNDSHYPPTLILEPKDGQSPRYYRVLEINYPNKTMILRAISDVDLDDDDYHCLIPLDNPADVIDKGVEYSARVENITLFHHCNPQPQAPSGIANVSCRTYDGGPEVYYWWANKTLSEPSNCEKQTVPVLRKGEPEQETQKLPDILLLGFEVDYSKLYAGGCSSCEKTGGRCGWSPDTGKFLCYRHNAEKWKLALGLAAPMAFMLGALTVVGLFWWKKRKLHSESSQSTLPPYSRMRSDLETGNSFFGIPVFSYSELQEATNDFDQDRVLGDGGFGIVYHGKLRDGREVAVKRLFERNYKRVGQFMNEVEILTSLKHPNLVTLYGCTSRNSRELLLVYEYIPNGTVADHLYGDLSESGSLSWTIRMKIAVQTAVALSYLHASDIIHRDVKTNNILLDNNFSVKVADFGLSRLFPLDATHVSTAPQGTPGYLDPMYRMCYQVTDRSDVYSFGVVLIELISSLPAIDLDRDEDEINLSTYAMNKIHQGKLCELVDQNLGFESDLKVKRMVTLVAKLAFQCIQQEKDIRPSMEEVLEELKRIESLDYEALEEEEMNCSSDMSKPAFEAAEREVEQTMRETQKPNSSPKSVIESWTSKSTVSNTSS